MAKKERTGFSWTLWLMWQKHFKVFAWIIFLAILVAGAAAYLVNPPLIQFFIILVMAWAITRFDRDMRRYNKLNKSW